MNDSFDVTTIIFALLAVFVVWKLRSVLGTRTGNEQPPLEPYRRQGGSEPVARESEGNVVRLPGAALEPVQQQDGDGRKGDWSKIAGLDARALPGVEAIAGADPAFDPKTFIDGAKAAYEMIIMSFAAGNKAALRDLLSKDVFESFSAAIAERETRGETVDTTFVSIDKALLEDAHLREKVAQISVRFQSKLITATRDRMGTIIDGNADKVVDMVDIWTFAREISSRDPNWRLVATEAGA
ncbi:MAG: calcium-binding protein [Hyphomicrobiales bacterium]|nr:calcium-binding protein [Hyphomicrobiales bacterium]